MARPPRSLFRRDDAAEPGVLTGVARVDRRTKDLAKRLDRGDVAVIDHDDIDRVAAESLIERGISVVLNAAPSSTGRYPNAGPILLVDAGIVLVDSLGPDVMTDIEEGTTVTVIDNEVFVGDELVAAGVRQERADIEAIHARSRETLGLEFERFVDNTVDYLDHNRDLLADDFEVPDVGIDFAGRQVLVVVRGHDYRDDLAVLLGSGYVRDMRPLLVGVDGGADALLDEGLTPDVIVGDFDSVSERALHCGAVLVVHAYPDGRAPGAERLESLGVPHLLFRASGTSEDIAMLLAYESGASLIVAVGTHTSMVDFLDKGRAGMASTVVTRMKVGPILVDAKGVSRLYRTQVRKRDLALMVAAAIVALVVIALVSEPIRLIIRAYWTDFTN